MNTNQDGQISYNFKSILYDKYNFNQKLINTVTKKIAFQFTYSYLYSIGSNLIIIIYWQ